jgi:Cof subfamily protein (haloacid dehalogenase superfamily)
VIRLIATDLDGTLLGESRPISPRNLEALTRAQDAGITVVLVSARHPRHVKGIAKEAGVRGPAICMNGALIYDLGTDEVVKHEPLELRTIRKVVQTLREELPSVMFHWEQEKTFGREPAYEESSRQLPEEEVAIRTLMDISKLAEPAAKLIVKHPEMDSSGLLDAFSKVLDDTVVLTLSDPFHLEISATGVHKGAALEWLCAKLDVSQPEVVAFGDMPNDIPMLTWAGRGVAMGNAHPSVKEIADEVTATNLEDGVADVIERLLEDQGVNTRSRKSTAFG